MTNIPNRAMTEHLSRISYCINIRLAQRVELDDRSTYFNYPHVNDQKPLGAILNFLLLFRHTDDNEEDIESNCCYAGFEEVLSSGNIRYVIRNVYNPNEKLSYDFHYHLMPYNTILGMMQDGTSIGTYIFIPESYVWYLSTEYPNRVGMVVKLQARTYIGKPLHRVIDARALPNHMLVLACVALQSGYPKTFETLEGDNVEIADLAYMPVLCSVDEQLIKDIMYSHGFTLEFSLPIEFEVRDVERVRVVSYDHVPLGNAYFASSGGLIVNHIIQPYANIRFWR